MFCPNCGNNIRDDAAFCPNCGFNLNEYRSANHLAPQPQAQPVPDAAPAQPQERTAAPAHFAQPTYQEDGSGQPQASSELAPAGPQVAYQQGAYQQDPYYGGQGQIQIQPRERVRDNWNTALVLIFSFLTLSIYWLYYVHNVAKGLNMMCEGDGRKTRGWGFYFGITLVTIGIYSLVWLYGVGNRIRDNAPRYGVQVNVSGGKLLALWLISFVVAFIPVVGWIIDIILIIYMYHLLVTSYNALAQAYNATL